MVERSGQVSFTGQRISFFTNGDMVVEDESSSRPITLPGSSFRKNLYPEGWV